MKRLILLTAAIALIFVSCNILYAQTGQATKLSSYSYNNEHLRSLSMDHLNAHRAHARKILTTGLIMVIGGPVVGITSFYYTWGATTVPSTAPLTALAAAGVITGIIGIPVTISGTSKKIKVKQEYLNRDIPYRASLAPTMIYMAKSGNYAPGIGIRISF